MAKTYCTAFMEDLPPEKQAEGLGVQAALVLDLEMDLDQIRKKTERWMRRLGIGEEDGN